MLLYVVMISTTRYHDDVNQWNFYLLHTSHVDYTVPSSDVVIIDVCIYSAQRFAPIIIPNYAGSVGNYFLLMTHMCCVMSCHVVSWYSVMLWHAIVYDDMLVYCMLLCVCT